MILKVYFSLHFIMKNETCKNKAYWEYNSQYLCGVHSKKYKDRIALKKDNKKKDELFTHEIPKEKGKDGVRVSLTFRYHSK